MVELEKTIGHLGLVVRVQSVYVFCRVTKESVELPRASASWLSLQSMRYGVIYDLACGGLYAEKYKDKTGKESYVITDGTDTVRMYQPVWENLMRTLGNWA